LTNTKVSSGKTPFTVLYDGTGDADQKIIGAVQKNGKTDRVLQLQGASGWASNVQCNIAPDNKQFLVIEIDIKAVSGNSPGGVVIGSAQGGSKTICVHCLHNGTFQYGIGDVSNYVDSKETYSIGKWYELKIVLDRTNNVFYSFADGKRVGYGLATSALTPDWFVLSAGNNGTNTTYYDNVRCYSTDNVEIDKNIYSWSDLQAALNMGGTVKLTQDIVDNNKGGELVIPETVATVLDLNGYVIDRKGNGNLFWVAGNLTIKDSSPDRTHSPAISYRNPVSGDTVVVKGGIMTGATNCAIIGTYDSTITLNGGTVYGNKSYNARGGAVDLSGSVFNMYGGALVNNYTPESGGAVRVYENATFNMYDGTIAHNTADKKGGGIYLWNNQNNSSILNMSGGEVTENVSVSSGAGVCIDNNGRLNISGTAKIKDNKMGTVENNVWGGIYVSGALEVGAKIGVSTYYDPAQNNPQQITFGGYNTYNNGEDPSKYFFSDKGFKVGLVTAGTYIGEVQLELELVNVSFVDGATTLDTVALVPGEKVTKPSDPVKDGYSFINWYSDPKFENEFDFDSAICKETTIYARFIPEFDIKVTSGIADKTKAFESEEVKVTAGTEPAGYVFDKWESVTGTVVFADPNSAETTFNMPAANVEVKATYKIVSGSFGENGDNLTWKIDYATGTLTVSGTGNMNKWGDTDSVPWYPVRDSIKSVVIADGVTSIGDRAFNGYSNITSVTIPGTVTSIGLWAFNKCTGIESVVLPEGTTTINAGAFNGCTGLTSVTIPGSVTAIGDNVFNGCTSLTEVAFVGTKEKWDSISIGSGNDSLINATMQFAKSDNTLSVKGKTAKVKYSKLRKKKQTLTVGKVIAFTNRGQGTLTYIKVSGSKKVSINKTTGKVTIKKKGLKKKKTYSIRVKVMAAGNENYNASTWKYVTFKIKVK
jgi:hypothetical protein